MFVKTTTVKRGNRSYRYLSLVEAYRDEQGKACHRTLYRLGEASKLRDSGELDRIIAALTEHAQGRWIDAGDLEAQDAPAVGGIAAVRALWERLGLEEHFAAIARDKRLAYDLADAVFAMVANRLCAHLRAGQPLPPSPEALSDDPHLCQATPFKHREVRNWKHE